MALASTPVSCISCQRSLPSRVRSPTPAKTEIPARCWLSVRMNSWRSTVLPTPAPPIRPALPPRGNGASRSMTLIPVSRNSVPRRWSTSEGAARWIGQDSPSVSGAPPSSGSPSTLNSRPSADGPDRDRDRLAGPPDRHAAGQPLRRCHRDGPDRVGIQVMGDFEDDRPLAVRRGSGPR